MTSEHLDGPTGTLRVAQIVPCTEAEGPGKRFALWFQGCPLRCPGCCNPEMLPFEGGEAMMLDEVVKLLRATANEHGLEGTPLLGGEPLAHAAAGTALAKAAHALSLTVMVFSGYVLEEARQMADPAVAELLAETDILVDGPYVRELPETTRRWIGSTDHRIHFLSDRCVPHHPRWRQRTTLELRLPAGELSLAGLPA